LRRAGEPLHVAAYIEALGKDFEKPTVKQHLAAIRLLFDWLVTGQVDGSRSPPPPPMYPSSGEARYCF
jgi:hypothetical protein